MGAQGYWAGTIMWVGGYLDKSIRYADAAMPVPHSTRWETKGNKINDRLDTRHWGWGSEAKKKKDNR